MMNCNWGLNVVWRCKFRGLFTFHRSGKSIQWFIARIRAIIQWWCGRLSVEWRWIGYGLSATFVVDKWFNKREACMIRVIVWCHRWVAMIWFTIDWKATEIIGAIWWIWWNHTGTTSFVARVIAKAIVWQYCVVIQTWQWQTEIMLDSHRFHIQMLRTYNNVDGNEKWSNRFRKGKAAFAYRAPNCFGSNTLRSQ